MHQPTALRKLVVVGGALFCAPALVQGQRVGVVEQARRSGAEARKAIESATSWLVKHQDAEGKWSAARFMKHDPEGDEGDGAGDARHDVRVTGLALLALMADGSTMRSGPHKRAVKRAVIWIKDRQIDGGFLRASPERDELLVVDHAIATLAISEAYQISKYRTLKRYVQRAVDALQKAQNKDKGWGRQPNDEASDPIATAWALYALRSAKVSKMKVDPERMQSARSFIDKISTPMTGRYGDEWRLGRKQIAGNPAPKNSKRRKRSRRHVAAFAALGIISRRALAQRPDTHPILLASADQILLQAPRLDSPAQPSLHDYFFGSLALHEIGGRHWKGWVKQLDKTLFRDQRRKGSVAGTWDPALAWFPQGGRVEATALGVLTLSFRSRYNRLMR